MGGFYLLVELHQEGSGPAACATGLFLLKYLSYISRESELFEILLDPESQCNAVGFFLVKVIVRSTLSPNMKLKLTQNTSKDSTFLKFFL